MCLSNLNLMISLKANIIYPKIMVLSLSHPKQVRPFDFNSVTFFLYLHLYIFTHLCWLLLNYYYTIIKNNINVKWKVVVIFYLFIYLLINWHTLHLTPLSLGILSKWWTVTPPFSLSVSCTQVSFLFLFTSWTHARFFFMNKNSTPPPYNYILITVLTDKCPCQCFQASFYSRNQCR